MVTENDLQKLVNNSHRKIIIDNWSTTNSEKMIDEIWLESIIENGQLKL